MPKIDIAKRESERIKGVYPEPYRDAVDGREKAGARQCRRPRRSSAST